MAYGYPNYQGYAPGQAYQPQGYGMRPGVVDQQYAQPMMVQQPGMISARYVTGREEAVAAQIMPDGNIWIFADVAHGKIYTKQVNPQNGLADFREYSTSMPQNPAMEVPQYATMADLTAIKEEIEALKANIPASKRMQGKEDNAK